jgi:hypothetical protein
MVSMNKDKPMPQSDGNQGSLTPSQWVMLSLKVIAGGFFLVFGVQILVGAYQLTDPFSFILTFFAANFIILISATLMIAFVYQAVWGRKLPGGNGGETPVSRSDNV